MPGTPTQSQAFVWDQSSPFEDWCTQLNSDSWYLNAQSPRREDGNGGFIYSFLQLVPAHAHANGPHSVERSAEN